MRGKVMVLGLALLMAGPVTQAAVVVEYHFDGDAQDSSGHGEHGTLMGGATFAPGQFGQALSLDGVNDYVHVPISDYTYTNFTLECWVNCPSHSVNIHYISLYQNAYLVLGNWSPGPVSTWANGLSPVETLAIISPFTTGTWHHFAFTYDGMMQRIYVDGVEQQTTPTTGSVTHSPASFPSGLNIGARYTGGTQYVQGLIDNARIHDTALQLHELGFYADYLMVSVRQVTPVNPRVAPGQAAVSVTVDVENTSASNVDVVSVGLTFTDSGAADVSGDYTVTPSGLNPVTVNAGATETFYLDVDVSVGATLGLITIDGTFQGTEQGTGNPVQDLGADTPGTWEVVGAEPAVQVVDAVPTEVAQGSTGHVVTASVENTGLNTLGITSVDLTFTGSADRSSEYTVTPDPLNPTQVIPCTTELLSFLVDVSPTATLEVITIDAGVTGTDQISMAVVSDADADITDSWTVVECFAPLCGDCNADGQISIVDALVAAQHSAGLVALAGSQFSNCNVLGLLEPDPAAAVTILDALAIAQHSAGMASPLVCC